MGRVLRDGGFDAPGRVEHVHPDGAWRWRWRHDHVHVVDREHSGRHTCLRDSLTPARAIGHDAPDMARRLHAGALPDGRLRSAVDSTSERRPSGSTVRPAVLASGRTNSPSRAGSSDSDNLVSNEDTFQTVIPQLQRTIVPGGVYLGVGPGPELLLYRRHPTEVVLHHGRPARQPSGPLDVQGPHRVVA